MQTTYPVIGPKSVGPTLRTIKIQNIRVQGEESLIDKKAPTEKMGDLVVPQIDLKKVQSSGFFYVKGGEMRGAVFVNVKLQAEFL